MKCASCGAEMQTDSEPDLKIEKCDACGGLFLDRGELDVLATGLAGDVEFCAFDDELPLDTFKPRACPRCADSEMRKIEFLRYTGVILDHCAECGGFFLDGGELEFVNAALRKISGRERGEELREHRDGRLVTVEVAGGMVPMGGERAEGAASAVVGYARAAAESAQAATGFAAATGMSTVRASVYFRQPLGVGLRVHAEGWTVKLAKAFGLYRHADIETGAPDFDKRFVVEADDPEGARKALTPDAQKLLVEFAAAKHKLVLERGSLQVLDDRLLYIEGPYAGALKTDVVAAAEEVLAPMLAIAKAMEGE
ncbi:MAG: zf-TFIIB domain-containing protein [Planctomycetota bacterium]|jgi:Zn-finger nucleic acid-binding protein